VPQQRKEKRKKAPKRKNGALHKETGKVNSSRNRERRLFIPQYIRRPCEKLEDYVIGKGKNNGGGVGNVLGLRRKGGTKIPFRRTKKSSA